VTAPQPWTLLDFLLRLDNWIEREQPLDDLRLHVTDWIFTRIRDPYADARRVPDFADYWQSLVPASEHFDDSAERCGVVCMYWVDPATRTVRCDQIASLSLPIE
jgi:hypothetical protein